MSSGAHQHLMSDFVRAADRLHVMLVTVLSPVYDVRGLMRPGTKNPETL